MCDSDDQDMCYEGCIEFNYCPHKLELYCHTCGKLLEPGKVYYVTIFKQYRFQACSLDHLETALNNSIKVLDTGEVKEIRYVPKNLSG